MSLKLTRLIYGDCAKKLFTRIRTHELKQECIGKKCTRQPAPIVGRNATFLSSQTEADQSTAETATLNEDHHEDIRLIMLI
jgi:hypothetical protein